MATGVLAIAMRIIGARLGGGWRGAWASDLGQSVPVAYRVAGIVLSPP